MRARLISIGGIHYTLFIYRYLQAKSSFVSRSFRKVVLLSSRKADTAHEHLYCVAISCARFKELNTVRNLFLCLFILKTPLAHDTVCPLVGTRS